MTEDQWWAVHNAVAHPVSEACYWGARLADLVGARPVGDLLGRVGTWVHDGTIPEHEPGTGRG